MQHHLNEFHIIITKYLGNSLKFDDFCVVALFLFHICFDRFFKKQKLKVYGEKNIEWK